MVSVWRKRALLKCSLLSAACVHSHFAFLPFNTFTIGLSPNSMTQKSKSAQIYCCLSLLLFSNRRIWFCFFKCCMGSEMSHFLVKNIIIHWKIISPWERNPVYISFLPLFKAKIVLICWEMLCLLRENQSPGLTLCSISVTDSRDVRNYNIQSSQMILAKNYGDQESPWEIPLVFVVTDQWWCFGCH